MILAKKIDTAALREYFAGCSNRDLSEPDDTCASCVVLALCDALEEAEDILDDVAFSLKDQHFGSYASLWRGVATAMRGYR